MKIDKNIKLKFSNNFDSVRKAFLILDSDHDGFITIEDFLRNFGGDLLSDPNVVQDLKKLMKEKDQKKVGKINYEDFSSWVGSSIH
jgi:Ca2+-binding EF-hand superfamily protein